MIQASVVALDLLDQRAGRAGAGAGRGAQAVRRAAGRPKSLDLRGLASRVRRVVRADLRADPRTDARLGRRREVLVALAAGAAARRRVRGQRAPQRCTRCCRCEFFARRSFAVTNVVSLSMYFGMFGSIFFMSQYLQNVLGNSALQAGVKMLVWTGSTMLVAPLAGYLSDRFGSRPFLIAGLALQAVALAWLAVDRRGDRVVLGNGHAVHPRRQRHGAGVRPGRQRPDVYLRRQQFWPEPSTGRFDGGVSILLKGDGRGGLTPLPPWKSGLIAEKTPGLRSLSPCRIRRAHARSPSPSAMVRCCSSHPMRTRT